MMDTLEPMAQMVAEAQQDRVRFEVNGGLLDIVGDTDFLPKWIGRVRPAKQVMVAYLELAALVAHYCAAIKSQLCKPYAPDDAQELLHGACQQPAAARAEIVAYMRRESERIGRPFAPLSGEAANDKGQAAIIDLARVAACD